MAYIWLLGGPGSGRLAITGTKQSWIVNCQTADLDHVSGFMASYCQGEAKLDTKLILNGEISCDKANEQRYMADK